MRRSASFGDILIGVIEKYEDELVTLDPEYIEGGDDNLAERKREALSSGDLETALLLTRDRRVKEVLMTIQSDLDRIAKGEISHRSASDTIRNLESRIAQLEGSMTASIGVRRSADKVLKAMREMEQELEKMPSFRGDVQDNYYADLAESWYMLSMKVEEEIKHIVGAY